MNVPKPEIISKVKEWLKYGDDDFRLAKLGLSMGYDAPYHLIAYHAQQSVEKYLKAYLVFFGVDFPYTHNLMRLLELCPEKEDWSENLEKVEKLIPYAVSTRYPGFDDVVTEKEAKEAVLIAKSVNEIIRRILMKKGLA